MNYLTLQMIKKQCRIDDTFTEDDILLESIGDGAEAFLADFLDTPLDDIAAENAGELPKSLYMALLILSSYMYDNDGSGDNHEIPQAFFVLTQLYKKYSVA